MSPEEVKDILVSDLPRIPSLEVAIRSQSERIDIPPVCFICISVNDCSKQNIEAVEGKFRIMKPETNPNLKAIEVCQGFATKQVED
jgi:hypothetical protein